MKGTCLRRVVHGRKSMEIQRLQPHPRDQSSMKRWWRNGLRMVGEELSDISRMLHFKERHLSQAQAAKNGKQCEHVTEEIMGLKSRRRLALPHLLLPILYHPLPMVHELSRLNAIHSLMLMICLLVAAQNLFSCTSPQCILC